MEKLPNQPQGASNGDNNANTGGGVSTGDMTMEGGIFLGSSNIRAPVSIGSTTINYVYQLEEDFKTIIKELIQLEEEYKTKIKELTKEMEDLATQNVVLRKRNAELEKKINIIVEGEIPLGPWGGILGSYWAYKTDTPVMEITLRYGPFINSVSFGKMSCDNLIMGRSRRFGGPGGDHEKKFFINSSREQLMSINLTYKEHNEEEIITSLCFHATQNTYGPFGEVCGHAMSIPIEGEVTGFHGRAGTFLNAIGIYVVPKVLDG